MNQSVPGGKKNPFLGQVKIFSIFDLNKALEKMSLAERTFTAVFFELFNFKMKSFQILGHLCIVGDQKFERR